MNKLYILLFLMFVLNKTQAQDVHFSQFYNAPGIMNPALTGQYRLVKRMIVNYRNQWASIPAPYVTPMLHADAAIGNCKLKGDHVGIGLTLLNDKSGNGDLSSFYTKLAIAYHKALDDKLRHQLSVGFQAEYASKGFDLSKLVFQNQYQDNTFNTSAPTGENFQNTRFNKLDVNAGVAWTSNFSKNNSFYVGGAMHHLARPLEQFMGTGQRLGMRYVASGGGQIALGDKFSVSPSVMYSMQTKASELNVGAAFGYHFTQNTGRDNMASFYLGGWYRLRDAVIIFSGIDYQNIRFSFSYDINTSALKTASLGNGGFELSLAYIMFGKDCRKKYNTTFCPRF
jgi:type IX secretion system PorP/SprF family membrane protein